MSGTLNPTKFAIEPYILTKELREESERSWQYMFEKIQFERRIFCYR